LSDLDASSPKPSGLRRYSVLIRVWALFLAWLAAFVALAQVASDWVNVRMAELTASVLAGILTLIGAKGKADGINVVSRVCCFQIIGECTAYYPCAIFAAAVLSFPCPWRARGIGLLLGIPAVLTINQARLLTLCYVYHDYYESFETAHIVVWQSLIIFFTVLLWIVWASTLARRHERRPS
jgi:exosortase/archaeosortase family protein